MAKLVFVCSSPWTAMSTTWKWGTLAPRSLRHFVKHVRDLAGCVYGRRTYEIHALLGRRQPIGTRRISTSRRRGEADQKWVVSRSLKAVGPNATLVRMTSGPCCASSRPGSSVRLTSPDQTWREAWTDLASC